MSTPKRVKPASKKAVPKKAVTKKAVPKKVVPKKGSRTIAARAAGVIWDLERTLLRRLRKAARAGDMAEIIRQLSETDDYVHFIDWEVLARSKDPKVHTKLAALHDQIRAANRFVAEGGQGDPKLWKNFEEECVFTLECHTRSKV